MCIRSRLLWIAKCVLFVSLHFVLTTGSLFARDDFTIDFRKGNWHKVKEEAIAKGKIIFVDVYTDWCAPCKNMDKTVFVDSTVAAYFNQQFISFKANAEDTQGLGAHVAKSYNINSYPSLLFVAPDGELISKQVGFMNKYELYAFGSEALELWESYNYLASIKSNANGDYPLDELTRILELTKNHHFDGKEHITRQYMEKTDVIGEKDLALIISNVEDLNINELGRIAPLVNLTKEQIAFRRDASSWVKWKIKVEGAIRQALDNATKSRDFKTFQEGIEVLRPLKSVNEKEIDRYYYEYYRRNDLDRYKSFAEYIIAEYITPFSPEQIREADLSRYELFHSEMMNDLAKATFGEEKHDGT